MENAQAAGEPWKTVVAVVTCLAALFTAIGYWFGSRAASNRTPNRKKFLAPFLRKKTFLPS